MKRSWFRSKLDVSARAASMKKQPKTVPFTALRLQELEERDVPASLSLTSGTLTYTAAAGINNALTVSISGSNFSFTDTGETAITGGTGTGNSGITFPTTGVTTLALNLLDGADTVNGVAAPTSARTITAASTSSTTATFTTSAAHGFSVGQSVTIAGMTPTGYNGTYTITGVPTATTFTCTLAATQTAGTVFGTATGPGALAVNLSNTGTGLTLAGPISVNGAVSVSSSGSLALSASILAGTGAITLKGNQGGSGANNLTQATTALITTTNATASALAITENTSSGGTGNANINSCNVGLANATAGTLTVNSFGGSIVNNSGDSLTAAQIGTTNGGGAPAHVLTATNYTLTGVGIGTTTVPLEITNYGTDTSLTGSVFNLNGGAGGAYVTDWGTIDVSLAGATATGTGGIRVVTGNASGHNLYVTGNVSAATGNIYLAADDNLEVHNANVVIGGAGFSGTVWMQANRDVSTNGQPVEFTDATESILTSSTVNSAVALSARTPTTQAVYLDIGGGTSGPGIVQVANITTGNGGRVVLNGSSQLSATQSGSINMVSTADSINVGATGTLELDSISQATATADYVGTAAVPIKVTGGNVVVNSQYGNVWVTSTAAANFIAAFTSITGQTGTPTLNLATTAGALTINGATSDGTTLNSGTINLNGAGGIVLGATLGGSTTGAINITGPLSGSSNITLGKGALTVTQATDSSFGGVISGSQNVIKAGVGNLTLTAAETYSGSTAVNAGTLSVNGSLAATTAVTVATGATLSGANGGMLYSGSTTTVNGTISPAGSSANGILNIGNLAFGTGGIYSVNATGATTPGTDYDQISVTGTVNLTGATLSFNPGYTPVSGDKYTIISNDGTDPVIGNFTGLSEGASLTVNGYSYIITYQGGDGNDVVLTNYVPTYRYVESDWTAITLPSDVDPVAAGTQTGVWNSTAFNSVNAAIAAANPGDVIVVNGGAFGEALNINKPVSLIFQYANSTFNSIQGNLSSSSLQLNGVSLTVGSDGSTNTLAAAITGTGGLTLVGGSLTLTSTNGYSGATTVSGGTLIAGASGAFGGNSPTSIASGATLELGGFNENLGTLSGAGNIKSTSAANAILTITSATPATFAGSITQPSTGTISVILAGSGALTLSGANSYTGPTTLNAGSIIAGSTTALAAGSEFTMVAGTTISLNGFSSTIANLSGAGTVNNGGTTNATLTLGDANTTAFTGTIADGSTGTLALLKTGTGTFSANAANAYSGGTTVSQGTLQTNNATGWGSGAITLADANSGSNPISLLLTNNVTVTNNITVTSNGTGVVTIGTASFSNGAVNTQFTGTFTLGRDITLQGGSTDRTTFTGYFTGTSNITVTNVNGASRVDFGRGATTLPISNFVGNITLGAGANLEPYNGSTIGNALIPDSSSLNFTSATSTLQIAPPSATDTESVNALNSLQPGAGVIETITGAAADVFTLGVGLGNASGNYSGTIIANSTFDTILLLKDGTGTQTLSGANTYTGGTTVIGGTLLVNNTAGSGLGSGNVLVGSLGSLGGSGSFTGTVTDNGVLAPGGVGNTAVFTTGAVTFGSGAIFAVDLNNTTAGTGYDQLNVSGSANLANANLVINAASGLTLGSTFTILTTTGGLTGAFANGTTIAAANNPQDIFTVDTSSNSYVVLTLTSTGAAPQLDFSSGVATFSTMRGANDGLTVSSNGSGVYTIADSAGAIGLTAAASTAGWVVNGDGSVTGPTAGTALTGLVFNLGDGSDQINALNAGSANVTFTGTGTLTIAGAAITGGNFTATGFAGLAIQNTLTAGTITTVLPGPITETASGNMIATTANLTAAGGIGAAGSAINEQIGAITAKATGGIYLTTGTGNLAINGITTSNGNIVVTNSGSGNITQSGAITSTSGNVTLSSANGLAINANINAGTGTINLLANQDGLGSDSLTQSQTGSTITTTNITANAVTLTVNTAGGGTGNASIRTFSVTAGTLNVNANGGSILYAGTDTLDVQQSAGTTLAPGIIGPAGSSDGLGGTGAAPTGTVNALRYVFTTSPTGTGSIGTAARPINTSTPASNSENLTAGSGGIYFIDWGNPLTLNGATATGAGNIVVVAANAGGHNLVVAGNVTTGSGNIVLAADDDFTINSGVTVGGTGFSGDVFLACNRDNGNGENLTVSGSVVTSNTTSSAVYIEGHHSAGNGTNSGAVILNNITVGNSGTITVSTIPTYVPTGQGTILASSSSSVLNAGPLGTVKFVAASMYGNATYSSVVGTATLPLTVTAGNVIIAATTGVSGANLGPADSIYVTDTIAGNFSGTTGTVSPGGSLNFTTNSGVLTFNGTTTVSNGNAINATSTASGGGIAIAANSVLGNSSTSALNFNAGTNTVTLNGTLTLYPSETLNTTATGGLTVANGGVLAGTGTAGLVTVQSGGTISPAGTAIGTLNTGEVDTASGSLFRFDINSPATPGTTYDVLNSSGVVNLAGIIPQIYVGNSYNPTVGDQFTIINSAGGIIGLTNGMQFAAANNSALQFTANVVGNSVVLTLTNIVTGPILDVTNGVLTYNGGVGAVNNALTVDYNATTGKYTFTEATGNNISLSLNASSLGYTGNGTNIITGPGSSSSITALQIYLGLGTDSITINNVNAPISVNDGGATGDTAVINGPLTTAGNFSITGFDTITDPAGSLINAGANSITLGALSGLGTAANPVFTEAATTAVTMTTGNAYITSTGGTAFTGTSTSGNITLVNSNGAVTFTGTSTSGSLSVANSGGALAIAGATTAGTGSFTATSASGISITGAVSTADGNISITNAAGTLNVAAAIAASGLGSITLGSGDDITLNANLSASTGTILINANTDGTGTQGFAQTVGTKISTSNSSTSAVTINVNTSSGGTGNASIRSIVATAGTFTANANGGSILFAGNDGLTAYESALYTLPSGITGPQGDGGGAPTGTINALAYVLSTSPTGSGSIGTAARPINVSSSSGASAILTAGSGGAFFIDWGNPLTLNGATANGAGSVVVVTANANGHNLTVAGPVNTGSGNIVLAADDNLYINAPIGSTAFNGSVYLSSNRDQGNANVLQFSGAGSITTTNATASAAYLDGNSNGGTITGGITVGNITVGNGGTITLTNANSNSYGYIVAAGSGNVLNAGAAGTVVLNAHPYTDTTNGLGTASTPITVTAGTVNITANASAHIAAVYVTDTIGGNFTVNSTGGTAGDINLNTTSGALTVAAASVNDTGGAINLTGAAGVIVAAQLGDGSSGAITINGPLTGTAGIVLGSGNLTINQATDSTFAGAITGSGGLVKTGLGNLTLPNANDAFTGTTAINGGTLSPVNLPATSGVTVGTGGTLGGSGTVNLNSSVSLAGGTIAPGGSAIGTLNTGSISAATTGFLAVQLNSAASAGTTYDQLNVSGSVTLTGITPLIYVGSNTTMSVGDSFVIINSNSQVTGSFAGASNSFLAADNPSYVFTASTNGGEVLLTLASISPPRLLDVSGGTVSYTTSAGINSGITLTHNSTAHTYTFTDTSGPITLTAAASATWTGSGTNTVTGPDTGITNFNIATTDGSDTFNGLDAGSATLTVNLISGTSTLNATTTAGGDLDITGSGNFVLAGTATAGGNINLTSTGNLTFSGSETATGNITASGFNTLTLGGVATTTAGSIAISGATIAETAGGKLIAPTVTLAAASIGTSVSNVDTNTSNLSITAGAGGAYITEDDGTSVAATATGGGNIAITSLTGTLNVSGPITTASGNISLSSGGAVTLGANLNAGSGTIAIAADTLGTSAANTTAYDQEGAILTTTNVTANALTITVNTAAAGAGDAVIGQASIGGSTGGTITVNSNAGNILWSNNSYYGAFGGSQTGLSNGGSNTQTLRARLYSFTTTGNGGVGTSARPIQVDNFGPDNVVASPDTVTASAGSGGVYIVGWDQNGNDLTVGNVSATGAGNIRLVAANAGGHNLFVDGNVTTGSGSIQLYADDDLIFTNNAHIGGSGFSGTVDIQQDRDQANGEFFFMPAGSSIVTSNTSSGTSTPAVQILGWSSAGGNDVVVATDVAGGGLELSNITVGNGGTIYVNAAQVGQGSIVQQPGTLLSAGSAGSLVLITKATDASGSTNASAGYGLGNIGYGGTQASPISLPIVTDAGTVIATTVGTSLTRTGSINIVDTGSAGFTVNTSGNANSTIKLTTNSGVLTIGGATATAGGAITLTGAGGVAINAPLGNAASTAINVNAGTNAATLNTTLTLASGEVFAATSSNGGLTLGSTGILTGTGATTNSFAVVSSNGSLVSPAGTGIGTLTTGTFTGATGGTVRFDLGSPGTAGVNYDLLNVYGNLNLGGMIPALYFGSGYSPAVGDTFAAINYTGTLSGYFGSDSATVQHDFPAANNSAVQLKAVYSTPGVVSFVVDQINYGPLLDLNTLTNQLSYSGGSSANNNNLTISYDPTSGNYTFADTGTDPSANPLTITLGSSLTGFVTNPDGSVTGNVAGIAGLSVFLGDGTDTLTLLGLNNPLTAVDGNNAGDVAIIGGTLNPNGNVSLTGFDTISEGTTPGLINAGTGTVTLGANTIGSPTQNILTQAGAIIATGGAGGIDITEADGANVTANDTNGGSIDITNTTGTLNVAGTTTTDTGNIILTSGGAVTLGANLNAGSGTIAIAADTLGTMAAGTTGYDQKAASLITTNTSTTALTITVNTPTAGAGDAVIGQGSIGSSGGGTATVASNGGNILWSSDPSYPGTFNVSLTGLGNGGSNSQTLKANAFVFIATGAATSLGTNARPLQTDGYASADNIADGSTLNLTAGSGGIYLTDWGTSGNNDITVTQAIAAGAGNIRVVAANAGGHNLFVDGPVSTGSGSIALYADDCLIFTANAQIGGTVFSGTVDLEQDRDDANGEFFYMDPNSSIITSNSSSGAATPAVEILGYSAAGSSDLTVPTDIAGGGLELGNIKVGAGGTILADAIANTSGQGSIVQQPGTLLDTGGTGSVILIAGATDSGTSTNGSAVYGLGNIGYGGYATSQTTLPINTNAATITATTYGTSLNNTGNIAVNNAGAATMTATTNGNANSTITLSTAAGALTLGGSIHTSGGGITLTGPGGVIVPGTVTLGSAASGFITINGALSGSGNIIEGNSDLNLTQNTDSTYGGVISGSHNFYLLGTGGLTLTNAQTYTGTTNITAGTLRVNGSLAAASAITVDDGASLEGTGTVGTAFLYGNLGAGSGVGNTGTLHVNTFNYGGFGSQTLTEDLNGTAAGQFDQLVVSGTANLSAATLVVNPAVSLTPGESFVILHNTNPNPSTTIGAFANDTGGGVITLSNGDTFAVNYNYDADGDGADNDVLLTLTSAAATPTVSTVEINNSWDPVGQQFVDQVQRSRVTSILVTFNEPVTTASFATTPITITRTTAAPTSTGLVNQVLTYFPNGTTASDASAINISQSLDTSSPDYTGPDAIRLTFTVLNITTQNGANPNLNPVNDAVQYGSLADGYWTLAIGSFATPNNDNSTDSSGHHTGLYRLFGDINADLTVDALGDQLPFGAAFGSSVGDANYVAGFDFNGDGTIDALGDQLPFGGHFGVTLS